MLHHNAGVAGCQCIVLAFDLIRARTHIKLDPLHPTSQQLTKYIHALDTISKMSSQCILDVSERASLEEVRGLINAQIEALLDASECKYDVSKQIAEITTATKDLLKSRGCEIFHALPGEFHVKAIRQKDLFEINKVLDAAYQAILLRAEW